MNCLKYVLTLYKDHKCKILYNGNHVIGVSEFTIFDYQNLFKKELLDKSPLVKNYSPIQEWHAYLTIERLFDLDDDEIKTYVEYLNSQDSTIYQK